MTAQATKPKRTRRTKQTDKHEKIIQVANENPNLSTREIGTLCDCSHPTVIRTLSRYHIEREALEDFKRNRADVFAGLQHRLISSCTDEDILKTPMGSRILAACQLYDKERLEQGKSTGNIAVLIDQIRQIKASET